MRGKACVTAGALHRKSINFAENMKTDEMSDTSKNTRPVEIELLAPARDAATAKAAIDHGADAVYMGAMTHGARRQAANSLADIAEVAAYAHLFGARLYVTVNTIIYEDELSDVERLVHDLWRVGVDALIVQDMALFGMNLPPIPLHASTQCDIRTPRKAAMLQAAGFSQLVLPRELSLGEIAEFKAATSVPLEAFVHGALCVSYSGDCQASFAITGRSANRGECAQICRYSFDLEDASGRKLLTGKHLLSLRDMNRLDSLGEMMEAGVRSFKIEGRLKDEGYVKNVVAAYSRELDRLCKASDGRFRRSSVGVSVPAFTPLLTKSFNRGFTSYFLHDNRKVGKGELVSFDTPKWVGEEIGVVTGQPDRRTLMVKTAETLHNGDGIGYFDSEGRFAGFRINRVDGSNRLLTASDVNLRRGTKLYRNADAEWERTLGRSTGCRRIGVDMILDFLPDGRLVLDIVEPTEGTAISVTAGCVPDEARTPQEEPRRRTLAKLGDTIYVLRNLTDRLGMKFVPASVLADLRRRGVETLTQCRLASRKMELRRKPDHKALEELVSDTFTRHDNVANSMAEKFYRSLRPDIGVIPRAIETAGAGSDRRVMQTRYCLRRELGACLRTPQGSSLPRELFLRTSAGTRLRLEFDCANCRMNVLMSKS